MLSRKAPLAVALTRYVGDGNIKIDNKCGPG
jgi:hypothetical protein